MNQEIKKLWVEALRSGKYTKTYGNLKDQQGHCCLGVLCELYVEDHPGAKWVETQETVCGVTTPSHSKILGNTLLLPSEVNHWAGTNTPQPKVSFDGTRINLPALNDGNQSFDDKDKIPGLPETGLTFNQIADLIEADKEI